MFILSMTKIQLLNKVNVKVSCDFNASLLNKNILLTYIVLTVVCIYDEKSDL